MKRIYCKDCKWATTRWNGTGDMFCTSDPFVEQTWSWAWGRGVKHAKLCETLNVDGQCALYRRRWSFWRWLLRRVT